MIIIFLICSVSFCKFAEAQDECRPTSCSSSGPIVRFPFRVKGRQPEGCGYPGFDLSCNRNNITEFEFQFPVRASARNVVLPISAKATVRNIDYSAQVIVVDVVNGSCLPNRVPDVSSSPSPFELHYRFSYDPSSSMGYTLFNCSGEPDAINQASGPITCLQHGDFQVYAYRSYYTVTEFPMSNCVKMYNISDIEMAILIGPRESSFDGTLLHWSEPSCGNCEANGKHCSRWRNNETKCFDINEPEAEHKKKGVSNNVVIAVVVVGVFVVALAFASLLYTYMMKKRKQEKARRIDQWLTSDRPSMKEVTQMLEGDNMPAIPPSPLVSLDLKTQN